MSASGRRSAKGVESVNDTALVVAFARRDPLDRHFKSLQSRLDRPADAAVTDEQHRAVSQTVSPRRSPPALGPIAHEVRKSSLRAEDEGYHEFRGGCLVHRPRVGEREARWQLVAHAVVADRLTLDQTGFHATELTQHRRRT